MISLCDSEEDTTKVLEMVKRIRLVLFLKEFADFQILKSLDEMGSIYPFRHLDKQIVQWQDVKSESDAEKIVSNNKKPLSSSKIKAKTRVDGLDNAEENFTYRRLREERVKSCCILASKLAFHQIRSSARSKRIFDADSTPIKAKRFRHDRFPLHHDPLLSTTLFTFAVTDQVPLDFLNECCVRHTDVKWAITFDSLPYPVVN
ncbi:unnamed protein product [Rhizophagus irregularis]|nr:unnamed protein product [Rhizophagus irregularis]